MREVDSLVEEVREDHIGNGDLQLKYVLIVDKPQQVQPKTKGMEGIVNTSSEVLTAFPAGLLSKSWLVSRTASGARSSTSPAKLI